MKKIILVTASVLTLSVGGFITANNIDTSKANSTPHAENKAKSSGKIINNHAKTDGFNSLSELEDGTPIIVRGIKTGKLKTHVVKSKIDSNIVTGYTETEFNIKEVFKNESNNPEIKAHQKISVGEKAFEYNNKVYTANGYKEMKNGKEYLLFLVEEDGLFAPRAITFGKIPLETNDMEIYPEAESTGDMDQQVLESIFKDAREKYGK